jgi:hypothetical protein
MHYWCCDIPARVSSREKVILAHPPKIESILSNFHPFPDVNETCSTMANVRHQLMQQELHALSWKSSRKRRTKVAEGRVV